MKMNYFKFRKWAYFDENRLKMAKKPKKWSKNPFLTPPSYLPYKCEFFAQKKIKVFNFFGLFSKKINKIPGKRGCRRGQILKNKFGHCPNIWA